LVCLIAGGKKYKQKRKKPETPCATLQNIHQKSLKQPITKQYSRCSNRKKTEKKLKKTASTTAKKAATNE